MNQRFILKNVANNLYWYGFYPSKNWTEDVLEAYIFDDRREMEDFIHQNDGMLEGTVLQVIEIWK
jgi:hypothetical protein